MSQTTSGREEVSRLPNSISSVVLGQMGALAVSQIAVPSIPGALALSPPRALSRDARPPRPTHPRPLPPGSTHGGEDGPPRTGERDAEELSGVSAWTVNLASVHPLEHYQFVLRSSAEASSSRPDVGGRRQPGLGPASRQQSVRGPSRTGARSHRAFSPRSVRGRARFLGSAARGGPRRQGTG